MSVVGLSNTGKTRVMEGLLRVLRRRGLRVAALKHAPHGFQLGASSAKDSARLNRAGAEAVGVVGPGGLVWEEEKEPTLEEVLAWAAPRGFQLVLVEGYKDGPLPKVEVLGGKRLGLSRVIAGVGREARPDDDPPIFTMDQSDDLAAYLLARLGVPRLD